jgi:hypothetical protein
METDLIPSFRRAVRGHLADRPAVAQPALTVNRHLKREFCSTVEEAEAALFFLESLGHLRSCHDPLGGNVRSYQVTAVGMIAHERGE